MASFDLLLVLKSVSTLPPGASWHLPKALTTTRIYSQGYSSHLGFLLPFAKMPAFFCSMYRPLLH